MKTQKYEVLVDEPPFSTMGTGRSICVRDKNGKFKVRARKWSIKTLRKGLLVPMIIDDDNKRIIFFSEAYAEKEGSK